MNESLKNLIEAANNVMAAGEYNEDGDFVLEHAAWDGECDPPDTSEPTVLTKLSEAIQAASEEQKDIRGNPYQEVMIGRYDEDGEHTGPIRVRITHNQDGIFIQPEGYGDHCSIDGAGIPVLFEYWGGEPRMVIWDDINQEDSSHIISLKNAAENLRILTDEERVANDEFKCNHCKEWHDADDSIKLADKELYCPKCEAMLKGDK